GVEARHTTIANRRPQAIAGSDRSHAGWEGGPGAKPQGALVDGDQLVASVRESLDHRCTGIEAVNARREVVEKAGLVDREASAGNHAIGSNAHELDRASRAAGNDEHQQ